MCVCVRVCFICFVCVYIYVYVCVFVVGVCVYVCVRVCFDGSLLILGFGAVVWGLFEAFEEVD